MPVRHRINPAALTEAIGLEVHVEGWGTGPFFTVRGYSASKHLVLLSKRYSNQILHRVTFNRVYFTQRGTKAYLLRTKHLVSPRGETPPPTEAPRNPHEHAASVD